MVIIFTGNALIDLLYLRAFRSKNGLNSPYLLGFRLALDGSKVNCSPT